MVETDLGRATIVYEGPDGEPVEYTVDNEHVAYFQDHWIVRTGEDEEGDDVVRRIPAYRVYHVERTVEQFEEEVRSLLDPVQSVADQVGREVRTLQDQVQSVTEQLGSRIGGRRERPEEEVHHIDVESGERVDEEEEEPADSEESAGEEAPDEDQDEPA